MIILVDLGKSSSLCTYKCSEHSSMLLQTTLIEDDDVLLLAAL